jgi:lysine 2,3-aminomutase
MPNYLISAGDDAVVLRNFEGQIVRYQAQDKPNTVEPTITRGVSSLLQGTRSVIVPEGSERMARRALRVLDNEPADGCCSNGSHPEVSESIPEPSPVRPRRSPVRRRARAH